MKMMTQEKIIHTVIAIRGALQYSMFLFSGAQ